MEKGITQYLFPNTLNNFKEGRLKDFRLPKIFINNRKNDRKQRKLKGFIPVILYLMFWNRTHYIFFLTGKEIIKFKLSFAQRSITAVSYTHLPSLICSERLI